MTFEIEWTKTTTSDSVREIYDEQTGQNVICILNGSSVGKSTDYGNGFYSVFSGGIQINSIAVNSTLTYIYVVQYRPIGSTPAICISNDEGNSFFEATVQLNGGYIWTSQDGQFVVAGGGSNATYSNDYGDTWNTTNTIVFSTDYGDTWNASSTEIIGVRGICGDGAQTVYVNTTANQIFKSTNSGATFTQVYASAGLTLICSSNGKHVWTGNAHSSDYGVTWTTAQIPDFKYLTCSNNGQYLIGMYDLPDGTLSLMTSSDYGTTFVSNTLPTGTINTASYYVKIGRSGKAYYYTGNNELYTGKIITYTTSSVQWEKLQPTITNIVNGYSNVLEPFPMSKHIKTDTTGQNVGFYTYSPTNSSGAWVMSTDYGETFTYTDINAYPYRSGTIDEDSYEFVACSQNLQYVYISLLANNHTQPSNPYSGIVVSSSDYGATFNRLSGIPLGFNTLYTIACNSTGQYVYAGIFDAPQGTSKKMYYSSNYGATWSESSAADVFWQSITTSANGQRVIAGGAFNSFIYPTRVSISNDYGATFSLIGPIVPGLRVNQFDCDTTGQYVVAATTGGVYRSTDYGVTWTQPNAPIMNNQTYKYISCDSTGQYILVYDNSVKDKNTYLSSDGGMTWEQQGIANRKGTENVGLGIAISKNSLYRYSAISSDYIYRNIGSPPAPPAPVPCFKENTQILTNRGYVPVQSLQKGDLVQTYIHGYRPVALIGRKQIRHSATAPAQDRLYRCAHPGVFGELVLTGMHSVLVDGFQNEAQCDRTAQLSGGELFMTDDKFRLPVCADESRAKVYDVPGTHTIYHFALEHDNPQKNYGIYANGVLVETCSKYYLTELSKMTLY